MYLFRCSLEGRVSPIEGLERFPSEHIVHYNGCHRIPHLCEDKAVLVIDSDAQGNKIIRELAAVAKEIIVINNQRCKEIDDLSKRIQHFPRVTKIGDKQMVYFPDGTCKIVDVIVSCTGHKHVFPYLHDSCGFNVIDEHGTYPLYKLTFNAHYPSMAFLGAPVDSTFSFYDMQVMWALRVWLGLQPLPHKAEMLADCRNWTDTRSKDLSMAYKELASCSESRMPSSALLGILKQVGCQAEEITKKYTVLSSEHWIVTND